MPPLQGSVGLSMATQGAALGFYNGRPSVLRKPKGLKLPQPRAEALGGLAGFGELDHVLDDFDGFGELPVRAAPPVAAGVVGGGADGLHVMKFCEELLAYGVCTEALYAIFTQGRKELLPAGLLHLEVGEVVFLEPGLGLDIEIA